ncbi:MAG: YkvA family protein [Deltaproteobacteria bacterium]
MGKVKQWAGRLKAEIYALYLACRDPRTPWYAKGFAALIVAYALSPIDLIPDFIPVLGYLDDLILIPAGLWLAIRMIPAEVMQESRVRARSISERPSSWAGIAMVILIWLLLISLIVYLVRT